MLELNVETKVFFRICIDWPESNVDVVYNEIGAVFSGPEEANAATPIATSVSYLMEMVFQDEEFSEMGISVEETQGLMMGCAAVVFSVDIDEVDLKDSMQKAKKRLSELVESYVEYYSDGDIVKANRVAVWS